ncbi:hypothetical protein EHS25_004527 [Saitozyma podzolica]|uniref:Rho-GAP domain-containing protein n=1 Tax=Saitozyma podzolica TaxID=1890683 RepID=A0A427YUG7_9TREE|nr:hypothetical protein EHS25_004527 [Saitozyma podzolica]
MSESPFASLPTSPSLPDMSPPPPILDRERPSRPLSELSENSDRLRKSAGTPTPNLSTDKKSSRPNSEVFSKSRPPSEIRELGMGHKDESGPSNKRVSSPGIHTITVNLVDYAAQVNSASPRPPNSASSQTSLAPQPPSPCTKPGIPPPKPEKPTALRTVSMGSIKEADKGDDSAAGVAARSGPTADGVASKDGVTSDEPPAHPLLVAQRASLRPSPLGPTISNTSTSEAHHATSSTGTSLDSSRSSLDVLGKPPTKSKPSWLRRASGSAGLRSKSKSPAPKDDATLPAMPSIPPSPARAPVLPPRKGIQTSTVGNLADRAGQMLPPETTGKSANATAGPSRSRLGDGQGRPAYSPASPPLPSRDNIGNIRGRLAAWTANAGSTSGFSRSESSATLSSSAPSAPSAFDRAQQRLPSSAQKVLGHAGSAVQKGWAGFRARGVGGSISNMSALGAAPQSGGNVGAGMSQKSSRDRAGMPPPQSSPDRGDGPFFDEGVILRKGGDRVGKVFGREVSEAGRAWGVVDAGTTKEGEANHERRRRACLPAVVVRAVEYLEIWGPKEEGIFRISGRSSHIARLRKEFDSGADLDIRDCHPGDLDPHAVSGIFKSYLRELPAPLLTNALLPQFEAAARGRPAPAQLVEPDESTPAKKKSANSEMALLLFQLPAANWFLLADIVKLLDLIPRHTSTNRMTLNALMLSLGPSLNIPGGILTELLEHRIAFFTKPPPLTTVESTIDLIDFGDIYITPPAVPISEVPFPDQPSRASTPASQLTTDSYSLIGLGFGDKPKKMPQMTSKASLTRLLVGSNGARSSQEALRTSSFVDITPPRVELPLDSPRLPSFESEISTRLSAYEDMAEDLLDPNVIGAKDKVEELHYPTGTVEDRAKLFSVPSLNAPTTAPISPTTPTPIADMFASTSSTLPSLRAPKSSTGSMSPSASLPIMSARSSLVHGTGTDDAANGNGDAGAGPMAQPANPATFIRRGPPVFFSSTGTHGRSKSVALTPVSAGVIAGVKNEPRLSGGAGDEEEQLTGGTDGEDEAEGEIKRFSGGSVKEMVKSMEAAA